MRQARTSWSTGPAHEPANDLVEPLSRLLNRLPTTAVTALFGSMVKAVDFTTSNVPGAPFPVYLGGAKMESQFPFGPLAGAALNITLLSYQNDLNIGIASDPAAVPDPEVLVTSLQRRVRRDPGASPTPRLTAVTTRRRRRHRARAPPGTAAGHHPGRAGRSVAVVDKATFPRDKICGDGLTTGALRHLEALGVDLPAMSEALPVDDVTLRAPTGREHRFELPDSGGWFAAIVPRLALDAAVVQRVRESGATVAAGHALTAVDADHSGVRATVEGLGEISADHLVAADGMWSPTRRLMGMGTTGYRGELHTFRQYVTSVSARASKELFVSFDADLLPGYFWSFPLADGGANVGYGILRHTVPTCPPCPGCGRTS